MLQKHVHSRRGLHEREELEVVQSDVDVAELAYLVRLVANKADWISSKIMTDLGCVEVLESTPRGNSSNGRDGTSRDASDEVLGILVAVFQHMEGVISARLGKILVKWVAVEDMLRGQIYNLPDEKDRYENNEKDIVPHDIIKNST